MWQTARPVLALTLAVAFGLFGNLLARGQQPLKRTDLLIKNASSTAAARALGFQSAPKGQPLQTNAP